MNRLLPLSLILYVQYELAQAAGWQSYDPVPRWGQSSSLAQNRWLIYGGKTNPDGGQTHDSAPNSNDFLALDLTDKNPSWRIWSDTPDAAPSAAYHTLSILSSNSTSYSALLFGGDVTGTSLPTSTDSSFLLTLPAGFASASTKSKKEIEWQHPSSDWVDQPMRRIKAATATIADANWVYNYIFGGLKNDDSAGFNELLCFKGSSADLSDPSWQQVSSSSSTAQPPVAYGHTMTLLSAGSEFRLVVLGGQSNSGTINDLDTVYIFTPDATDRCSGTWTSLTPDGTSPTSRQGHVAISLSSTEILIHGGASAGASSVYDDLATLTFNDGWTSAVWEAIDASSADNSPGARYEHSAAKTGSQVLFAFGYGSNNPADVSDPGYAIYDVEDQTWTTSFTPDSSATSDANPGINSGHGSKGSDSSSSQDGDGTGNSSDSNSNSGSDSGSDEGSSSGSDSSSGDSEASDSDGSDENTQGGGNGDSSQDDGTLHTPGVNDAPPDSGDDGSSGSSNGDGDEGEDKGHVGIIMGSVAAVVVIALLAAGCIYWTGRRKRQTAAYYGPGGAGRRGEGAQGLIGGAEEDGFDEKAAPAVMMRNVSKEGVKSTAKTALASVLGVARRVPKKGGHRWDMLADEESNYSRRTASQRTGSTLTSWPSGRRTVSSGWQEAPLAEPVPEEMRKLAAHEESDAALAESNRAGLQIWDDVYGRPAFDRAQASKSYMSHALGPWLGRAKSLESSTQDDLDLHDLPADPCEVDEEKQTGLPLPSPMRPAGPRWPSSLYSDPFRSVEDEIASSNDQHTVTDESFGVASSTVPSTILTSEQSFAPENKPNKPFANALRQQASPQRTFSHSSSLSGSSFGPQPYNPLKRTSTWWSRFGAGVHSMVVASPSSHAPIRDTTPAPLQSITESPNPFDDEHKIAEEEPAPPPAPAASDEQGRKPPGTSSAYQARQTPSQSSEVSTGTVMLDRMGSMQVVQHSRYGSSSQSSASMHSPYTEEGEGFVSSPTTDEGPAVLMRAASSIKRPNRARRTTAGPTGVRQMIAEIEERGSSPTPPASPYVSPRKKRGPSNKVEHGLAPRPHLFLANPD